MAYATVMVPGDGVTTLIPVNFALGVLENEVVTVQVTGEPGLRTFTWVGTGMIQVDGAPAPVGQQYVVRRSTPLDTQMVNWLDGEGITEETLTVDQLQALHLIQELFDKFEAGGGTGGIPDAPIDGATYARKNASWVDIAGEAGAVAAFSSRANAIAAQVPPNVSVIAVVHSGQALLYRRFTGSAQAQNSSALWTNSGTVYWNPADDFTPLHYGAMGDGVTNDRDAFVRMFQFMYGLPPTVQTEAAHKAAQEVAFAGKRPFVVNGRNRVYATAGPIVLGNVGAPYAQTGMVYRLRINELMLKAIPGNWDGMYDAENGIPRALLIAAWQFPFSVSSDAYTGIYDVTVDHPLFDCQFLTSGMFIQGTYQMSVEKPRFHHMGKNGFGFKTSDHRPAKNPNGLGNRNGALMVREANIEGLVTESGLNYPTGEDQDTMNTIGMDIRSLDFRIDAPIISGVTKSMYIDGRAGQIYNLHPWAKLVEVDSGANNIMFCNGYLDFTKFILRSFGHKFIGMHWIIPNTDTDRGVELQAVLPNTTGLGLLFSGCTFDHFMDIKYTTSGTGTWVGDKQRLVVIDDGCTFGAGSTTAQIARYKNLKGITAANGASWFRDGDETHGEIRLLGQTMHIAKDRTADGDALITLTGVAGDITSAQLRRVSGTNGALRLEQNVGSGAIALIGQTHQAWFLNTGEGEWTGDSWMVGFNRPVDGSAQVQLYNKGAGATASAAFRSFEGPGVEIAAQQTGGWIRLGNLVAANAIEVAADGHVNVRTSQFRVGAKNNVTLGGTEEGWCFTPGGQMSGYVAGAGQNMNLSRSVAGYAIKAQVAATAPGANGLYVQATGALVLNGTSDIRQKEDLRPVDVSVFDKFGAYNFKWKANEYRANGVVAQELLEVLPEMVSGSEEEGYGVAYTDFIPLLVAAVKDLRDRVAYLEKRHGIRKVFADK